MKIAIVGDSFVDIGAGSIDHVPNWGEDVATSAPIALSPGGSALNTCIHLQSLLRTSPSSTDNHIISFYSAIGQDHYRDFICNFLNQEHGLELSHVAILPHQPTGVCIVLSGKDDRCFVTHYGATRAFNIQAHVDEGALLSSDHVHFAGYYNCRGCHADLPRLFRQLHAAGVTISLDTNYDSTEAWDGLKALLPYVDVFLPNDLEAKAIAQTSSEVEMIAYFQRHVRGSTVVTRGKDGVLAIWNADTETDENDQVEGFEAMSGLEIVDPTGAGDAFNAGFLYGWKIHQSKRTGVQVGIATASLCVQARGACNAPKSWPEIQELMAKQHV